MTCTIGITNKKSPSTTEDLTTEDLTTEDVKTDDAVVLKKAETRASSKVPTGPNARAAKLVSTDAKVHERPELVAGLPAEELERRLRQAHRQTEVGHRLLAFYLHEMQARGVHQLWGYGSAVHYAVERLDMCRRKAQLLVAVGGALLSLRAVDRAFARAEITWSKVALLCRVAVEETEAAWLAKARDHSCRELEWLVRSCRPGDRPPSADGEGGLPAVRFHVHAELGALDFEIWERAKQKLARERGMTTTDAELMAELSRMLLSTKADGSIPGRKPVEDSCFRVVVDASNKRVHTQDGPVPLSDPEVEAAISDGASRLTRARRNKVLDRDGHRCRCCRSPRNLQIHHVRFVSRGGETKMDNLLALCSCCHSRIHEGFLRVRRKPGGEVEFQDRRNRPLRGTRPRPPRPSLDYRIRRHMAPELARSESRKPESRKPESWKRESARRPSPARNSTEQEARDRAFVLQNLHGLTWRGGKMVLV